ncbi:MAG: hypothetical protein A2925_04885 [Candidatus Yanofskybacteria bacterium RIFCSPLOWO2_01_FULL_44_22]|uniref:Uncharacterized protein n=1 Tax=Candidatus Yanofskybacteria bacterium RIFCSPLOWO2_01_FULL_44_22 TaxID=1802697 RepID=A0A1F8GKW2_9BACT|nr:MAG: hypothetical protein A2925_04885 [Candidatus Yanofskybacteria bacterium RIFCSPLOWO2_01_FULL_44_22]
MSKSIAEQSSAFSIFWLKRHGYLHKDYSQMGGTITWTYGYSENKSSIGFSVMRDNWGTPSERTYVRLNYTHTDYWSKEKSDMNYEIQLESTPCRYGGKRYWFICPLTKNGRYCGRRVGVLYCLGKWFGCRHCGEIAYAKQMEGGKFRWNGVSVPDIERAEKEVKRYYYNGKPTRKYRRVIRLNEKFENGFFMMSARLRKSFK